MFIRAAKLIAPLLTCDVLPFLKSNSKGSVKLRALTFGFDFFLAFPFENLTLVFSKFLVVIFLPVNFKAFKIFFR